MLKLEHIKSVQVRMGCMREQIHCLRVCLCVLASETIYLIMSRGDVFIEVYDLVVPEKYEHALSHWVDHVR